MHTTPIVINTERLRLRQWQEADRSPFAALCADPVVMEFFPNTLSRMESDALIERASKMLAQQGWGFWAVEIAQSHTFIGFVGMIPLEPIFNFAPGVEIGWRLDKEYWGTGYATEAAQACLHFGFTRLNLEEIVAFTTLRNRRSQNVMQRLGMIDTRQNFRHPTIPDSHPLAEHVLYKITQQQWQNNYR